MAAICNVPKHSLSIIPTTALEDCNLSLAAKGLYCTIFALSKDNHIDFNHVRHIISDSELKLSDIIDELLLSGYLSVNQKGVYKISPKSSSRENKDILSKLNRYQNDKTLYALLYRYFIVKKEQMGISWSDAFVSNTLRTLDKLSGNKCSIVKYALEQNLDEFTTLQTQVAPGGDVESITSSNLEDLDRSF